MRKLMLFAALTLVALWVAFCSSPARADVPRLPGVVMVNDEIEYQTVSETITVADVVGAEKVLASNRKVRQGAAVIGGIVGAGFGYQAAAAAALGPGATVVTVVIDSLLWAGYAYGVTTAGMEYDIHRAAKAAMADVAAAKKKVTKAVAEWTE